MPLALLRPVRPNVRHAAMNRHKIVDMGSMIEKVILIVRILIRGNLNAHAFTLNALTAPKEEGLEYDLE